jgi:predicted ATPase
MDGSAGPQVTRVAVTGHASRRPFIGREQELADLAAAVDDAVNGRGSFILLTGEPGIGKTRLISEVGRHAAKRGVRVVSGRCWEEGGAPPYWPWMQVVRSIGGDLEQLMASAAAPWGGSGGSRGVVPEVQRIRLFDAIGRFLGEASAKRPVLVTLDDVHAADEPSLLMLRFLSDALAEASVLFLASYREREPRVRELGEVFAELARVGRRVPLRALTPADVEAYITNVTGSVPTRQVVARLHEITAGNPFFVREIVRMLAAEDTPKRLDEAIPDPFQHIPEEVRTLIRRRVASLEREVVDVLRVQPLSVGSSTSTCSSGQAG